MVNNLTCREYIYIYIYRYANFSATFLPLHAKMEQKGGVSRVWRQTEARLGQVGVPTCAGWRSDLGRLEVKAGQVGGPTPAG